jgi:protein TonB
MQIDVHLTRLDPNIMPKNYFALIATAVAMLFPVEVGAQSAEMPHHTTGGTLVTIAEWSQRMQSELERRMIYPIGTFNKRPNGMVRIKFNCSEDGRPSNVTLLKSSGNASVDHAAMRAVRKMASLHPLPTGFTPATSYEALVLFATGAQDLRVAADKAERIKRNDWYHDPLTTTRLTQSRVAGR